MLGCDSPSFPSTVKVTIQAAARGEEAGLTAQALRRVSLRKELRDERVERWLDRAISLEHFNIYDDIKEPEVLNDLKEPEDCRCPFDIWAEPGYAAVESEKAGDEALTGEALQDVTDQLSRRTALKDVSNLQKPAYLGKSSVPPPTVWLPRNFADFSLVIERNSFSNDKLTAKQPPPSFTPGSTRAADFDQTLGILEGRRVRPQGSPISMTDIEQAFVGGFRRRGESYSTTGPALSD